MDKGTLYLVATPIGNLEDITLRGVRTLTQADFIAAEDTRVTAKLLNHLGISKPMVSYYEHNLRERGMLIISRILAGEVCALVSDAGSPCVSDPGEDLVRLAVEHGIDVYVIPGACAAVSALSLSGLCTSRFCFEGFLTVGKSGREERLNALKNEQRTIILYEAPHKLMRTLSDLLDALGNRRISVARELTKLHEEVIRTDINGAIEHFTEITPRGELVLVVEGAPELEAAVISLECAVERVHELAGEGMALSQAAKLAAKETGYPKSELYKLALSNNNS